ncbi:RCC1/BLIP-II [Phellopilus nigrolimitatus]|nr:RCC1/BLIP-II [Phellopilus nigrolimitatus]
MGRLILLSAGSNSRGQLAQGSLEDSYSFRPCAFSDSDSDVGDGSKVLSIAAGANHTLALIRPAAGRAQLWGCGDGCRGQLGGAYLRDFGTSSVFRRIQIHLDSDCSGLSQAYADCDISCAAASLGIGDILLSVGSDDFGDLGIGGLQRGKKETAAWQLVSFAHLLPESVSKIRIEDLKAGPHDVIVKLRYTLGVDTQCKAELIAGWGAARHGQLGHLPGSSKEARSLSIVSSPLKLDFPFDLCGIAVGNQHTVFLTSEGSITGLGSNRKNQICGIGAAKNVFALGATWNGTYLLQTKESYGEKWMMASTGSNSHGQLARSTETSEAQLDKIKFPAAAGTRWGSNRGTVGLGMERARNLGLGHTNDVYTPTLIWPRVDVLHVEGRIAGAWAGCATSWLAVEVD